MTQQDIKAEASPTAQTPTQQSTQQTALQPASAPDSNTVQVVKPHFPVWPTSKPGPHTTPPTPGMVATHVFRPEQYTEIGDGQTTGEPDNAGPEHESSDEIAGFDPKAKTGQEALGKRKQRL